MNNMLSGSFLLLIIRQTGEIDEKKGETLGNQSVMISQKKKPQVKIYINVYGLKERRFLISSISYNLKSCNSMLVVEIMKNCLMKPEKPKT
ncbi:CLUMA_CG015638, isoform A [Clunio marinus]|uniref:CLUMA_CG015638, isoform A n=1 Tax=Clunio marinus TaxID=568069 RepID=A0A1J1IRG1_9DIPT|nr:CLUMA_CG015638, isoform A [Clunio marinus]